MKRGKFTLLFVFGVVGVLAIGIAVVVAPGLVLLKQPVNIFNIVEGIVYKKIQLRYLTYLVTDAVTQFIAELIAMLPDQRQGTLVVPAGVHTQIYLCNQ